MYDIIVIGGGPAGLTAALYALRAEKSVVVFEKKWLGGQIALSENVENFPGIARTSGAEFSDIMSQQIKNLGGDIVYREVSKIIDGELKTVVAENDEYTAKAIIIATGVQNKYLDVNGETEFIGKGISFCPACDGTLYKNKTVAVIGGGNTAIEDAEYLANIAKTVYLIHRRKEFKAERKAVKHLKEKSNVRFVTDCIVKEFYGDSNALTGLKTVNVITNQITDIVVDGAFIAIGKTPQSNVFESIVDTDAKGFFVAGENCHTNRKGIFVAGDCRNKTVRQLTTAVGDGSVAALAACRFIDTGIREPNPPESA